MLYINQQDYPHIPYRNNMSDPESKDAKEGTAADAACGICSMMMVIDRLTMKSMGLEEGIRFSEECKANMEFGTDMEIYGPYVGERFGLVMTATDDEDEMADCLMTGGAAIINVGGNHDSYEGVLSDVGHYVIALSYTGKEFVIIDPAYRKGKYDEEVPSRAGKVRDADRLLYVKANILKEDTANRSPAYYLFRRIEDKL